MRIPKFFQNHNKHLLIAAGVLVVFFATLYGLSLRTQALTYSYDGAACEYRLVILPSLFRSNGEAYRLTTEKSLNIGSFPVAARSVCAVAQVAPSTNAQTAQLSLFGGPLFPAKYEITAAPKPVVMSKFDAPIPTAKPLKIALDRTDTTHSYRLAVSGREVACSSQQKALSCDVVPLNLTQGQTQTLELTRSFDGKAIDTPLTREVQTQTPTTVTASSIAESATVYDKPKTITLTADKPLAEATVRLETAAETPKVIPVKATVEGNEARIAYDEDLARETKYKLVTKLVAKDGSSLLAPHELSFSMSGGPKVTGASVGSTGYISGTPITLSLDQPVKAGTDITKFVELKGIAGTIALRGQQIVITPQAVDRCTQFSIGVKKGLVSEHDITSAADWSLASRARCYTTGTIGTSVQGRGITAYYFGNGPTTILYAGAIHGNELSSKYIMESWISELDAKAADIPADKTIVVVPVVNPDGTGIGQRNNARGVNLNRNFPTSNWTGDIQTGSGFRPGEGGSGAGSEPETQALMNFTRQLNPAFTVTFHSSGRLVNSNDAGNSIAKGRQYASLAGYSFIPNSATTGTFGFEMTGTYEDWLLERGSPAILIELNTNTGNHFAQNRSALWAMLR